jgi:glycosyltransferase involved in cell wall biosynthesis
VVLDLLVRAVHSNPSPDRVWLLRTALTANLPTIDDVQSVLRHFELSAVADATVWLLESGIEAVTASSLVRPMRVLTGGVCVDVDHSAQHELHTGIQQVTRRTVPRWERDHEIVLVAWTPERAAHRMLSRSEHDNVGRLTDGGPDAVSDDSPSPIVVPWRGTVVLAEVPPAAACDRLAAVARYSGNRVCAIGYDCIPIVSADLVPLAEPNRFGHYLSMIKYAQAVAGISVTATEEFGGFASALRTQGLAGPDVTECLLPVEGISASTQPTAPVSTDPLPLVLSVGTFEPRKNHLALLYASERLWREGMKFRLRLVGGSGWGHELPGKVRDLQARGYPLTMEKTIPTAELAAAYRDARFSVFASLHEGYGLPVAESIAVGTPVITSNFGSTKEVGEHRGAELIDPRDDEQLVEAMRRLLSDDDHLAELRAETRNRSARSWDDYARDLWRYLVSPDRAAAGQAR